MINASYADALFLVFIIVVLYLGLIGWEEYRRAKRNAWHLMHNKVFHCANCHHSFVPQNEEEVSLTRCPRCNAICIKRSK